MICHKIGLPPISTMGLGLRWVSSERRVPKPPAKMTAFITLAPLFLYDSERDLKILVASSEVTGT